MFNTTNLPSRASDAGTDISAGETPKDWMDYVYEADEHLHTSRRLPVAGTTMCAQITEIEHAIDCLNEAKGLLVKEFERRLAHVKALESAAELLGSH